MTAYEVLIDWTDEEGSHRPGDTVRLDPGDAREQVEIDRLIRYGIVAVQEDLSKTASQPEAEPAPAKQD